MRIGGEVVSPDHELETASKATAVSLAGELSRSHHRQQDEQNILLLLAVLGLLLVMWRSHRLNRLIGRPLGQMRQAVEELDLESVERLELPRTPELAALAGSFNDMADRLATSTPSSLRRGSRPGLLCAAWIWTPASSEMTTCSTRARLLFRSARADRTP